MQTLNRGVCAADAEHPACQVDEGQIKKFLAGVGIKTLKTIFSTPAIKSDPRLVVVLYTLFRHGQQ